MHDVARASTMALLAAILAAGCAPPEELGTASEDATELSPAHVCTAAKPTSSACAREKAVAERLEAIRGDADALAAFVSAVPKGGDLHSHLSGAVPTEKLIEWAQADALCVNQSFKLVTCTTAGSMPVAQASKDDLLRAWSMQDFDGTVKEGHDHFFATFGNFGLVTKTHTADMLAAVRSQAASQGESYLELMLAFGTSAAGRSAETLMGSAGDWSEARLLSARSKLVADQGFKANIKTTAVDLAKAHDQSEAILGCGGQDPDPGCAVQVRYLVQVWRASSRESVWGQIVYGYELGKIEPRVVGLNLAAAEDNRLALDGYQDAMHALAYARQAYVHEFHVALHAGELVASVLGESDQHHLGFHIKDAVLTAGAERIGHGIDILSETSEEMSSEALRDAMRERNVAVEICLSSNEFILGVEGPSHPMSAYRASNVPMVVATDDEGVSRSTMSDELLTAVVDQSLGYKEIKELSRRSLAHAFLPGQSLFADLDAPRLNSACKTKKSCKSLAASSQKAALQSKLELALAAFEADVLAGE